MKTQKQIILEHFLKYKSLTSWDSIRLYGDTRLSDKIYQLKKDGYKFKEEWITKKNRNGIKVKFKKYILAEEQDVQK